MHIINDMKIVAKRTEVLAALRENRMKHAAIVKEARAGYIDKAQIEIAKRLEQLKAGKLVSLSFSLRVPVDYTKVYDTTIRMMELHQEDTIPLDATQVRNLIMDEWDWSGTFYGTNKMYSSTAAETDPNESEG